MFTNALALLFNWRVWGSIVLATVLAATHWKVYKMGEHIIQVEMTQEREAATTALLQAQAKARLTEQQWIIQQTKERNDAAIRESKIKADAGTADAAADSLRSQLADTARRMSGLTPSAHFDADLTIGELLNQCTTKYTDLAEIADRHSSDIKTLVNSWPK